VSNLYIGNLSSEVTCEMLLKIFNKFGEVESAKLMLPRNEEEKMRRRNCAFIKYASYEPAYLAKEALKE
jgi:U2-associated protein SR140